MRIREIELCTSNLSATKTFYHNVMAFPLLQQSEEGVSFAVGYSIIHFCYQPVVQGIYHFAMLLPKNQLPAAYEWIRSRIPVLPFSETSDVANFTNWNAEAFYFHDAAQNILEMIVHHDLDNQSEAAFSPQDIVGICEIGITVDNVEQACADLHNKKGIPYFRKGPYGPKFAVMGEEDGLLIISAEGRGWIPTGQPATKDPLRIEIENDSVQTVLQY